MKLSTLTECNYRYVRLFLLRPRAKITKYRTEEIICVKELQMYLFSFILVSTIKFTKKIPTFLGKCSFLACEIVYFDGQKKEKRN